MKSGFLPKDKAPDDIIAGSDRDATHKRDHDPPEGPPAEELGSPEEEPGLSEDPPEEEPGAGDRRAA